MDNQYRMLSEQLQTIQEWDKASNVALLGGIWAANGALNAAGEHYGRAATSATVATGLAAYYFYLRNKKNKSKETAAKLTAQRATDPEDKAKWEKKADEFSKE